MKSGARMKEILPREDEIRCAHEEILPREDEIRCAHEESFHARMKSGARMKKSFRARMNSSPGRPSRLTATSVALTRSTDFAPRHPLPPHPHALTRMPVAAGTPSPSLFLGFA
jgi:hypothetical protein